MQGNEGNEGLLFVFDFEFDGITDFSFGLKPLSKLTFNRLCVSICPSSVGEKGDHQPFGDQRRPALHHCVHRQQHRLYLETMRRLA